MPISYNAQTGEGFVLDGETWKPAQVAKVPQTGETFVLDGAEWRPVPKDLPKPAPERSVLESIHNVVGGVADAAASAVPFSDEMGAGVRAGARYLTDAAGLTTPRPERTISDVVTEKPGQSNYERALADIRGRDRQFAEEHPYLSTAGKVAGGLTMGKPSVSTPWNPVTVAPTVARSLPSTIARSSAIGGGYGAVAGFADGEGGLQNRLDSAVEGGAAGALFGAAVPTSAALLSRFASPARNLLTPRQQQLAGIAGTEGIPLTAAQSTGNRALHSLEALFETHPMTAGTQATELQAQRTAFNRAALRRINETGDDLAPATLNRARTRIGGDLQNLASQAHLVPDAKFTADLAAARAEYSRRLDAMKRPVFDNFADDIEKMMTGGGMPGATYQSTRSTLSTMANSAHGSDPYFARALRALRNALDEAADRVMPTHLKGDWAKARGQWGNLRTLEKAMDNTTTQAAAGNLSPTQLSLHVRPGGPMEDLADVGTSFVRGQVPNSGTPERLFWQNLLTNPLAYVGGGLGAAVDPVTTAATVGTALYGPRLAQMLYNTGPGQAWLRNQRLGNATPELRRGLLSGFAGAAGGGLLGP